MQFFGYHSRQGTTDDSLAYRRGTCSPEVQLEIFRRQRNITRRIRYVEPRVSVDIISIRALFSLVCGLTSETTPLCE